MRAGERKRESGRESRREGGSVGAAGRVSLGGKRRWFSKEVLGVRGCVTEKE